MAKIYGNTVGSSTMPKSYILETEDGTQLVGVLVGEETVMTATANDIRKGKIAATADGIIEGEKDIPAYRTTVGAQIVLPGNNFSIPLSGYDKYDYTKLQCMIVVKNTKPSDSVATEKVVLDDAVYPVQSIEKISDVTKNLTDKSIELNFVNDTEQTYYIRYYTYRQEE